MMAVSLSIGTLAAIALITIVSLVTGASSRAGFIRYPLDGTRLSAARPALAGLSGGVVQYPWVSHHPAVVVFYASWCAPCREELPRVASFAASHDLGSVRFMGMDVNDTTSAGLAFARGAHVRFVSALDPNLTVTPGTFQLSNLPDTVFVNSNGVVSQVVIGAVSNAQLIAGINALR